MTHPRVFLERSIFTVACPTCGVTHGSCQTRIGDWTEYVHKARAIAAGHDWPAWWRPARPTTNGAKPT